MSKFNLAGNTKNSNIKLFVVFITATVALFSIMMFLLLIPKINSIFDTISKETNQASAQIYAEKLQQYIKDRELALKDIANNGLITRSILLGDNSNSAFIDYISHQKILGEDADFIIIDAVGDILYAELDTDNPAIPKPSTTMPFKWALSLLSSSTSTAHLNIADSPKPKFELAVPVFYGAGIEGIIIARITADPYIIYENNDHLYSDAFIEYSINTRSINSDTQHVKIPFEESLVIYPYKIRFTYARDHLIVLDKKQEILNNVIASILIGFVIIFTILFFLGRRIIVEPYQALATIQQAISSAVEGIAFIDINDNYVSINNAGSNITGHLKEELQGKSALTNVHPDEWPVIKKAQQEMKDQGKASVDVRALKKDGSLIFIRITLVKRNDDKGIFIGHHRFLQDITIEKNRDEKIRKQQQDLQLIFNNVPVKIWYKDDKNRILRLNKQAAESMGGTIEDFEGKDTYDLFPETAKKYHDDDLEVIRSNKPQLNIIEEHTPIDGPKLWVSTDKIPYTDPVSKDSFLFVCAQNITELKMAELRQAELVEKLSHTNTELEQFAYIASHDLKAPLRGIQQLANWIKEDCEDLIPEDSKNHLDLMASRVLRMGTLLDDLLSYSRISQLNETEELVDLEAVFSELFDLNVNPFGFKTVLNVPKNSIIIPRKPLEIIVRNLLDNAVKHHDKVTGTITISYDSTEAHHIIDVEDDGPGIQPDLHERAFQIFQTLKPRDKVEGSGMGLAIIKKILHRYKGEISIHSDGTRGARFCIKWPIGS
jgi:PAS domain S-box-containing protein